MTRSASRRAALLAATTLVALALAACGGDGDNNGGTAASAPAAVPPAAGPGQSAVPQVAVDDLAGGRYIVSVGNADLPTVGKYYAAADGRRLLLLADDNDAVGALYRRGSTGPWVAVPPPTRDVRIALLGSNALPAAAVEPAQLAGRYVVALGGGAVAGFSLTADGSIVPGASACKLSGSVQGGGLPQTLRLNLAASGCAGLPATAAGVLVVDGDDAPARFRLVADNGERAFDLWAYAE